MNNSLGVVKITAEDFALILARAVDREIEKRQSNVIRIPLKVIKPEGEKEVCCRNHIHLTRGEVVEPCKFHGDTKVCTPFDGHVCLVCVPFFKEQCHSCGGKRYECSC